MLTSIWEQISGLAEGTSSCGPVFLAKSSFDLRYTGERAPDIRFADIKDVKKAG